MKISSKILKCLLSLSFVQLIFIDNQALAMEDNINNVSKYKTAVYNATRNLFQLFTKDEMKQIISKFEKYNKNNVMAYK